MEKTRETVEILRMAYGKGAVAKLKSGKTAFVFGGVPSEVWIGYNLINKFFKGSRKNLEVRY